VLPDATFLGENGRVVKLSDFSGKALAFTFIFTRCPLPDFCPRMNRQFQGARKLLQARANGPANWQLLSLSFDPEHDRPDALARHARIYRGADSDRWLFAVVPTNVLASLAAQVDFHFTKDGGSLMHNLRTVVLDPHRRIYRQFTGNQWTAEELAQALVEASGASDK
jgi:protein SCO1/2